VRVLGEASLGARDIGEVLLGNKVNKTRNTNTISSPSQFQLKVKAWRVRRDRLAKVDKQNTTKQGHLNLNSRRVA
jgi:hypothetical protein